MDESLKQENSPTATKEESLSATTSTATTEELTKAHKKKELPKVSVVRNWKEYLGESLLIIFSVILALGLTEVINNINDERRTKEVLHQLKEELITNKKNEEEQYA